MEDGKWNQKIQNRKFEIKNTPICSATGLWVRSYANGNSTHIFYFKTPINTHDKKISNTEYPILNDEVKSIFDIQNSLFNIHEYP